MVVATRLPSARVDRIDDWYSLVRTLPLGESGFEFPVRVIDRAGDRTAVVTRCNGSLGRSSSGSDCGRFSRVACVLTATGDALRYAALTPSEPAAIFRGPSRELALVDS